MGDEPHDIRARVIDEIVNRLGIREESTFGRRRSSCYTNAGRARWINRVLMLSSVDVLLRPLPDFGPAVTAAEALAELTPDHRERLERIVDRFDEFANIVRGNGRCDEVLGPMLQRWLRFNASRLSPQASVLLSHVKEHLPRYTYESDLLVWLLPMLTRWAVQQCADRFSSDLGTTLDALRASLTRKADELIAPLSAVGIVDFDAPTRVDDVLLCILQSDQPVLRVPPPYATLDEWTTGMLQREVAAHALAQWDYVDESRPDVDEVERRRFQIELTAFLEIAE
jgi:hypothetical protein